jgi:SAM-dependent methyltransferase
MSDESYEPRSYWNRVATELDERGGVVAGDDTPYYRYKRAKFLGRFLASMPVEGKAVLEVGCGPGGNLAELMNRQPRRLVGCDLSPAMANLARRTGCEVVELDGTGLPFGDQEFDLVFTVTVLQHVPEVGDLISEICRVSRTMVQFVEDAGPAQGGGSYFRRPVAEYSNACRASGFTLVQADVLGTRVSLLAHTALGRVFDRRERHEGEPVPPTLHTLERLLLPITRRMDDRVAKESDLTRMIFERR